METVTQSTITSVCLCSLILKRFQVSVFWTPHDEVNDKNPCSLEQGVCSSSSPLGTNGVNIDWFSTWT